MRVAIKKLQGRHVEKLLPQNIEAECGVLGSIIIDPEAIVQVAEFLFPDDFYRDAHRTIYEVILQLYEQREPADFITICDELERRNKLEAVGGASYITSLINQVPTSGNVEFYGRIVERNAILRRLIEAAGQIAAVAYEEEDADVALDKAEQLIFNISQRHARSDFSLLRDILSEYMNKLDQLHERRGTIVGVPTGFTDLDRLTGGLQRSDLIIVDYLQLMQSVLGSGKRNENRVQEISEVSRNLKALARELNLPVLALAQLSRAVETRQSKVPQLSDLRESGSLEQDADIVMFIYRDDIYNPESERKNIADIIVAK